MRTVLALLACLAAPSALAQVVPPGGGGGALSDCDPANEVAWPSALDPTWEFCWIAPADSSGLDGSGIELVNVRYRGVPVMGRAGMPIVNVLYDDGAPCGPGCVCGPCYRDWTNEPTAADPSDPNTAPDGLSYAICGREVTCPGMGSACSVTFDDQPDRLAMTAVMSAGWYRYTQQYVFHESGLFEPRMTFSAVEDPCIYNPHVHHAYFRLDLDIAGAAGDAVRLIASGGSRSDQRGRAVRKETVQERDPSIGRAWRVAEGNPTRATFFADVFPEADDEASDAWGGGDAWILRYADEEHVDGSGCEQAIDRFVDGDGVSGADVVLWLAVHSSHDEACCAVTPECVDSGWFVQFSW